MSCSAVTALQDEVLRLVPMDVALMRALADGRMNDAERALGAAISGEWSLPREVLAMRIAQLEADPRRDGWLLNAVVLREAQLMIGNAGFHGPPGEHVFEARWPGVVELGYDVVPGFRRQGHASRAIALLLARAKGSRATRAVLSIAKDNIASQRTARRAGFTLLEEYEHDARGRELLYSLELG